MHSRRPLLGYFYISICMLSYCYPLTLLYVHNARFIYASLREP